MNLFAPIPVAVAICGALAAAGCGSSSGSGSSAHASEPTSSTVPGAPVVSPSSADRVPLRHLEHALLYTAGPPRPTSASCQGATTAERRQAPFGNTSDPEFSCVITVNGERALYDVQVLANGCYVAERVRLGQAVYGCGADPPSEGDSPRCSEGLRLCPEWRPSRPTVAPASPEQPIDHRVARVARDKDSPKALGAANLNLGPPSQVSPGERGKEHLERHDDRREHRRQWLFMSLARTADQSGEGSSPRTRRGPVPRR